MAIDRNTAWAELHDVSTAPERLRDIAAEHPEFADAIARHPSAYPELLEWMRSLAIPAPAEPTVHDELRDPGTSAERLMAIAQERPDLAEEIAGHPSAYPDLIAWLRPPPTAVEVVSEPLVAPEPLAAPEPEELDLADRILIGAATGAQAFDELGFVFAVQEMAMPLADRIRSLVRPDEELQVVLPGVLVTAERHDAIALFARDRLVLVWKSGGARSQVIRYADVTAARIGTAPSELADVLALYLQAQDTVIFAVPTDDPVQADFLAHLVRGVPLGQIRPDLVDDAVPADSPELAAARAELAGAAISGERVNALAAAHPELHVELAGHPRTYPDLLDWLESRPDPRTREAVAARRARDSGGVLVAPPAAPVGVPVAYAAPGVSGPNPIAGRSGWERADKALDTADKVGEVAVNVAAVIYGIFLIVAGIALAALLFGTGNAAGFFGILVAIYGVYVALPLPGFKIIIW